MNLAQKAVLQAAIDAGKMPMEQSAEFMLHDLVQACIDQLKSQVKLYADLGEQQQDAVNAKLQSDLKETVYTAARILAGAQVIEVPLLLDKLDTGKQLKLTGFIASDDAGRHQLMDMAHKKQKVLILLHDMNYFQGLDNIQSDKDQKALPLDSAPAAGGGKTKAKTTASPTSAKAVAAKPIEIPPKLLADAIEFVERNQVCTTAGLQNGLKIATKKAEAVQAKLAELGHIALNADNVYQIVRDKPKATGAAPGDNLSFEGDDAPLATVLTDEIYADIKAKVVLDGRVSVGALAVAFDLATDLVEEAILRLEADQYISAEDEDTGERTVLIKQD
tara:strand:- start:16522 stop:17520 length:999 start_codon:yes stop_codon:yes gene_type:complete